MVNASAPLHDATPAFQLKGGSFTGTVLELHTTDLSLVAAHLAARLQDAAAWLRESPVILNLDKVAGSDADWAGLVALCRANGVSLVGIRAPQALLASLQTLDVPVLQGLKRKGAEVEVAAVPAPAPAAAPVAAMATGPSTDIVLKTYADRPFTEVKLDGMRKTIAARLTEAKQTIPHFYLRREVRLDALMAFREQLNKGLESRGIKLSVNDFIIKACALALQAVPNANAVWAGDRILKLKPSDVAVAVAVDGGLFTPVLRDADSKTLSALSAEMKDLAARAKTKKLAPHEYQGGSFAISNLGMMGVENFDAVINPPHGSILAVGAGLKTPVVAKDGTITVATVMSMTLSVDHRVIDGALGAEFLKAIIENLENPVAMLA